MEKSELLKKIKAIEIKSNILSNEVFSGEYHSYFKGNGMEFAGIRQYSVGDDVKNIDWKVSARSKHTYVKEYKEERELNFNILIDISSSVFNDKKKEIIAEIVALLSLSASKNNDRVGAYFFSDKVDRVFPLKTGKKHSLAILDYLLSLDTEFVKTDLNAVLKNFNKRQKKKSIVIIISDFIDEGFKSQLDFCESKHDLILIRILDNKSCFLPKGAIFELMDSETGKSCIIDNLKHRLYLDDLLEVDKTNMLNIDIEEDYISDMVKFFKYRRAKRKKR